MISFQIYEVRADGSEWHSVPLEVAEHHHVVQTVKAGYTRRKRAAISPEGKLLYGMSSVRPNGTCVEIKSWDAQ